MMKNGLLIFCLLLGISLNAQLIGGQRTYRFLGLSPSARVSGLAGNLITVADDDVNLAYQNPAALNPSMHQQISFNHSFHIDGIGHGFVTYGHHAEPWNTTFYGGLKYVQYGEFERTNEFFQTEGTFKANEYALVLGAARQIDERLHLGTNLKIINSQFDIYQSVGIAADIALFYRDTSKLFTATLLMKNAGTQLSTYSPGEREPLPFEMQIGVSKRLQYLPFRFSIIYEHLQTWNILYDDPNLEDEIIFLGQDSPEDSPTQDFLNTLARHFVFNGELLLGAKENFRLRFGYRHVLRQELSAPGFGSLAGFTFGLGMKINRFRVDYGRYNLHLGGGINHFTLSTNIQEFK
jgi:hypothetical protein